MKYPNPVKGRAVWTAADLATDSNWIHKLDQDECAEVTSAVKAALAKGLDPEGFNREDFKLPGLLPVLTALGRTARRARLRSHSRFTSRKLSDGNRGLPIGALPPIFVAVSQNSKGQRLAAVTDHGLTSAAVIPWLYNECSPLPAQ